ncbi:hypothetical protein JXB31_03620 [Candidatus Woesearchaeota archaeon]|nr:hypothetical protein [Candidatus Woesearchaeota archaeon]
MSTDDIGMMPAAEDNKIMSADDGKMSAEDGKVMSAEDNRIMPAADDGKMSAEDSKKENAMDSSRILQAEDERTMQTDESKRLSDVPPENHFRLCTGAVIKNLNELLRTLREISDDTFRSHVYDDKNDFASWVSSSVGDPELAERLVKTDDRLKTRDIIEDRVFFLRNKVEMGKIIRNFDYFVPRQYEDRGAAIGGVAMLGNGETGTQVQDSQSPSPQSPGNQDPGHGNHCLGNQGPGNQPVHEAGAGSTGSTQGHGVAGNPLDIAGVADEAADVAANKTADGAADGTANPHDKDNPFDPKEEAELKGHWHTVPGMEGTFAAGAGSAEQEPGFENKESKEHHNLKEMHPIEWLKKTLHFSILSALIGFTIGALAGFLIGFYLI